MIDGIKEVVMVDFYKHKNVMEVRWLMNIIDYFKGYSDKVFN